MHVLRFIFTMSQGRYDDSYLPSNSLRLFHTIYEVDCTHIHMIYIYLWNSQFTKLQYGHWEDILYKYKLSMCIIVCVIEIICEVCWIMSKTILSNTLFVLLSRQLIRRNLYPCYIAFHEPWVNWCSFTAFLHAVTKIRWFYSYCFISGMQSFKFTNCRLFF